MMKLSALIRWMIIAALAVSGLVLTATLMEAGTALALNHSPAALQGNGGATAQSISVGNNHACAVMSNGWLLCWGSQSAASPVLGDGTSAQRLMPVDVVSITAGASRVAAGGSLTCAIVNGSVKCWGGNTNGQLGTGNTTASNVPTNVVGLSSGATEVTTGNNHACAVVNGAAKCWGTNTNGQLGNGNFTSSNVPTDVVGLTSNVTAIVARINHSCAIAAGGAAKCWGLNTSGQLGTGNTSTSNAPTNVVGLSSGVTGLAAGSSHSCAIVSGAAQCWGDNFNGQLGTGNTADSHVPTDVVGLASGVTSISAAATHSCAVVNGGLKCWGANDGGQLGTGNLTASLVPTDVLGLASGVVGVVANGTNASSSTTCALLTQGGVKCWGASAALGVGYSVINANAPREVLGLPEYCIFTGAINDDWANARNWSNCGGVTPQAGDAAVIGRPSTSGIVPQMYATTTVTVNRLRVIGSFNVYGQMTAGHVFGDNIANLNPNPNQNNYRFFVISPANLTVTQNLTWSVGYLDGTGNVIIQPGAVGAVQGNSAVTASVVSARIRNYGVFTLGNADMGTQWTNEASGVMNFTGGVYCCSTSGGTFTNRGVINAVGVNRLVPVSQYSGTYNISGTVTRTTNFIGAYIYGGVFGGTGIFSDAVYNIGGVVAPGGLGGVGALSIGDFYSQSVTATLDIDVGGATPGAFDQLNVTNTGEQGFYPGRARLGGGILAVHQRNGYVPQTGDEIRFMNFNIRDDWFGIFHNDFGAALTPGAYATYASLLGEASVGLYAKANPYSVAPGNEGAYNLLFENPFSQSVTLQAITYTLPLSVTYKPNSATGGVNPTITAVNGREQLVWALSASIPAASIGTFNFGVNVAVSATNGMYTSTIAARTSASPQDLTIANGASMLVQAPFLDSISFATAGTVVQRAGKPAAINLRRGVKNDPFLVHVKIGCPVGKTCNDPLTDILSVTLKIAAFEYTMTMGAPGPSPFGPASSTVFHSAQDAVPLRPGWADPPDYHRWEPGVPCDQQLPAERCDPGPGNPHRTDDCPIPIVTTVHWADGSTTEELIGCGSLYDPSGFVRDAFSSQPISNATVSLYRVPFALPDTSTQTRQCRTVDTRPGGAGGNWNSLPPANIASGTLEDESLSPARIDPPSNPQLTDSAGHYGWDVATGCWFVVVSAPGYMTKTSAVVGVPPAVTDLDILLTPEGANKLYLPLIMR